MVEPGSAIYAFTIEKPSGEKIEYEIRRKSLYLHKLHDTFMSITNKYNTQLSRIQKEIAAATKKLAKDNEPEVMKEIETLSEKVEHWKENIAKENLNQYLLDGVENILKSNGYEFDRDFWFKYVDSNILNDIIVKTITKDSKTLKKKAGLIK